mmetsp:Transcript_26854/g.32533  ORF Transcript_26854/g.32533 Transcript_26854/m.32533 type:complete len:81 (-) Transcript_26854:30-272(-)
MGLFDGRLFDRGGTLINLPSVSPSPSLEWLTKQLLISFAEAPFVTNTVVQPSTLNNQTNTNKSLNILSDLSFMNYWRFHL